MQSGAYEHCQAEHDGDMHSQGGRNWRVRNETVIRPAEELKE